MMVKKWFLIAVFLSLIFSACAPLSGTLEVGIVTETVETSIPVSPTPEQPTSTPVEPTQTSEPVPSTGSVMGKICYPSEFIPSMVAYFQNNDTNAISQLQIAENQNSYTMELEPGDYTAFAYLEDQSISLGGMYSEAIACGLTAIMF